MQLTQQIRLNFIRMCVIIFPRYSKKRKDYDITMAFSNWEQIEKIDAHIHILPDTVHAANPNSDDPWLCTNLQQYSYLMDEQNIKKAIIMPLNDPWLMSMEFTVEAVHHNLWEMKEKHPGKFYAFADIDVRNSTAKTVEMLTKAIDVYGLDGIKIHPNNTGIAIDDVYNHPIFELAQKRNIPIAIHSYPNSESDVSATKRIIKIMECYPNLKLIVSHMGAFQWEDLLRVRCYVDMSAILSDYAKTLGVKKTNEILRNFGVDRLLFATDYPDNRNLLPAEIYATYYHILNQMDFSEEEARRIAYQNAKEIFG